MRTHNFRLINDYAVKNKALITHIHRIGASKSLHPQSFTCHKTNNSYAICKILERNLSENLK